LVIEHGFQKTLKIVSEGRCDASRPFLHICHRVHYFVLHRTLEALARGMDFDCVGDCCISGGIVFVNVDQLSKKPLILSGFFMRNYRPNGFCL
jgi:hypothetical protein